VADAISRLPKEEHETPPLEEQIELNLSELLKVSELFVADTVDQFSINVEDIDYPLAPQLVEVEQKLELNTVAGEIINAALNNPKSQWEYKDVEGAQLIHFCNRIYVPKTLRKRALKWYHHYLCHPGGDRLSATLAQVCTWKGIVSQAREHCKRCSSCQKYKRRSTKYGHLPPKEAESLNPWHTVCVDLIGPYSLKAKVRMTNGELEEREISLQGMTFIDPATGWFEIAEVPAADKTSARISRLFDQVWLSRYPRPRKVLYDNGSEFKKDFQPLVKDFAVKATCTSIKNPQSNAILERIHQVVGSMLKTKDLVNIEFDELDMWNPILASVAYAIRCSHHSTLNATPGQLIFGRDMLLDLKFEPNYKQMWAHKQKRITYDNVRENSKRISHDYKVDEYAYILKDGQYRKLEGDKQGPFRITEVFSNGTVRLQKGVVNERLNIRRLTPHFGEPPNQDMV
jgi:hypothetical protein